MVEYICRSLPIFTSMQNGICKTDLGELRIVDQLGAGRDNRLDECDAADAEADFEEQKHVGRLGITSRFEAEHAATRHTVFE